MHSKKNVDIEQAQTHQEGKTVGRLITTWVMKEHFPKLVQSLISDDSHIDGRYGHTRTLILRWCARQSVVISRIQLETCEINLDYHITEAKRLGLASEPHLPSSLQDGSPTPGPEASPNYSPREEVILSSVQSQVPLTVDIESSDDDFM